MSISQFARCLFICLTLVMGAPAMGQQSKRFGDYELHYTVVNTQLLSPEVATAYDIKRSKNLAIVNLALRKHSDGSTTASSMALRGSTSDLMQRQQVLEFREIREGEAIYYIAEFKFINEDWHRFDIDFLPEGAERSTPFSFKQQVFSED